MTALGLAASLFITWRALRGPTEVASSVWDGSSLVAAEDELAVGLGDGSSLHLAPGSRVEMGERSASAVKVVLKQGKLFCHVRQRPERAFFVEVADLELRVLGTRFTVASSQAHDTNNVEVQVEEGVIEVRTRGAAGEPVRVEAGRSWSRVTRTGTVDVAAPGPGRAPTATPASEEPRPDREPPANARETRVAGVNRHGGARGKGTRATEESAVARAEEAAEDARLMFARARTAWREGRMRDAAAIYEGLLRQFPRDGRAGLAAFELGRIRMDRLDDAAGAARALEQAAALAPNAELREDAMARLVSAHARAHDQAACARARDAYLARYPDGVHRRVVLAACSAP